MSRQIGRLILCSTLLVVASASMSSAAIVDFSGTVSLIDGPFRTDPFGFEGDLPSLDFSVGSPLSGRIVWDDSATNDSDPSAERGEYLGALTFLQIELGSQVWQVNGGNVEVLPGFFDPIQLSGILTGDSLGSFAPDFLGLDFDDPDSFIQSDVIPSTDAPFASLIEPGGISLNFVDGTGLQFEVEARFDYTVVPEPTSAMLMGLGLMALARRNPV